MSEKIKVYLSASINNALNNEFICSHLHPSDFEVYLPQTITPNKLNHENFPLDAYQGCLDMMNKSDIGLLLLDSYGRDCAWEAGWYTSSNNKKLVAFVESSSHFMRDWMIKGGIDIFITTNPRIYSYAMEDPILKNKKIIHINDIEDLGREIKKAL